MYETPKFNLRQLWLEKPIFVVRDFVLGNRLGEVNAKIGVNVAKNRLINAVAATWFMISLTACSSTVVLPNAPSLVITPEDIERVTEGEPQFSALCSNPQSSNFLGCNIGLSEFILTGRVEAIQRPKTDGVEEYVPILVEVLKVGKNVELSGVVSLHLIPQIDALDSLIRMKVGDEVLNLGHSIVSDDAGNTSATIGGGNIFRLGPGGQIELFDSDYSVVGKYSSLVKKYKLKDS